MITPAYAPTATERVLPRMALDFTTGVLDPRVTVTRALNTATRVNSSGAIEIVNANLPRFDYDPATLAPKGLLIEETRTNILLQSSDFANVVWTKANSSVSSDVIISPDGTQNADKLVENSANTTHGVSQSPLLTAGTHTQTIFAKAAERNWLRIICADGGAYVNLSTGVFGTVSAGTVSFAAKSIKNYGNGWYRIEVSFTAVLGANTILIRLATSDGGQTYLGNGVSGAYVWGAQLEAGAFATSYIPTTTTSLTRNADVVSMTGTNFSDWYNSTSGAILARSSQSVITGTRPSIYISDGTANNIISLRGLAANPELYIKATTDQAQIDAGTLTANSSFGLVGAWATNNCAAAINGGAAVTDTSATIPTVDQMLIGSDGTNYLNGQIERISYWLQRIINAEAQAFSK